MSSAIRPFTIDVPQAALDDLGRRIAAARFPERETVDDWTQGIPLEIVRDFADHWANGYDWRRCEAALNAYPQFLIELGGVDIHFLHIRSPHEQARPLLMTHGWPGSIREFLDVIEPLTRPEAHGGSAADAFHLVIPSLPGYGFSGKPGTAGWDIGRIAGHWDELMLALGYDRYFAQGGDWGAAVTSTIAMQDRGHCAAVHVNMVIARPDPETLGSLTPAERKSVAAFQHYEQNENGYAQIQRTKPQTLGFGLADSAVGQLAWILEKFNSWSDIGDTPFGRFDRDALLDNISIYWLTNSGASSARLYWHSFGHFELADVSLPFGATIFPNEIFRPSRRWAEKIYSNIIYWNEVDRGGHFAAFEVPDLFIAEVRACFCGRSL
ncbi:MAG: epoxide hydrolase [Blastomonas sp.]